MVGTIIFGTSYWFMIVVQCHPISDFWERAPGSANCLDLNIIVNTTYAAGIINALADWTFGVLPIFIVRHLNMARRLKALVAGLLAFAAM
jgi:hypothetical protein